MFGKTIWLPKCQVTNSRCEDVILLHFYLQMLNDMNVKNSWESLGLKFQNLSFNPMQNSILERNRAFGSKKNLKLVFLLSLILYFLNRTRQNSYPTGYGQTAQKWTKRWFDLLLQSAIMFKMVILMFSWYLQGIFMIGPIHQHKTLHVWDNFSLVCYLLIIKRYLRTTCYVPKLL